VGKTIIDARRGENQMRRAAGALIVVSLLGIGLLSVPSCRATAMPWYIQVVDQGDMTGKPSVGDYSSIALDSSGYAHISYYDETNGDLKYARWNGIAWERQTVDSGGDVGTVTSIAIDSHDHPHISYCDETNGDLKYATLADGAWEIQTVDGAGSGPNVIIYGSSLALDSSDRPHISYLEVVSSVGYDFNLKYAHWTGTSWAIATVDSEGTVSGGSIALDGNDFPHISYYDGSNGDLKYAEWTGASWTIVTVDQMGDVGASNSIALDSSGFPHISYVDVTYPGPYPGTNHGLKLAKYTGSSWSIETIDSGQQMITATSIALDADGNDHISYIHQSYDGIYHNDIMCALWTGGSWDIQAVDPGDGTGIGISIAVDSFGRSHISYSNILGELKYARGPVTLPSEPDNLQAAEGHTLATLTWSAPYDDGGSPITNYKVYRATAPGQETLIITLGSVLEYTDYLLEDGQTYYYQVSAVNGVGEGTKSSEIAATPGPHRMAAFAGHGAWPEHHNFVMSEHGPDIALYGKMENVGTMPVKAGIAFYVSDDSGNFIELVYSEAVTIPVGEKVVVTGTWAVSPGSFNVLASCIFDSDGNGSLESSISKPKEFSFKVVP